MQKYDKKAELQKIVCNTAFLVQICCLILFFVARCLAFYRILGGIAGVKPSWLCLILSGLALFALLVAVVLKVNLADIVQ